MSLRTWLNHLISGFTATTPVRSGRHQTRLHLESLEGRELLSAGSLDPTFGVGGRVATDFLVSQQDIGYATTVQPDGKLVAVGAVGDYPNMDFGVARYNPDGSLDAAFGTGGRVATDFGAIDSARGVALQTVADQLKIVVLGRSQGDFALARYNSDGSLDATFGSGGRVIADSGAYDEAWGVTVQPDGKILAVGSFARDFAVLRYNVDGTLDTTFDGDGIVTTRISSPGSVDTAHNVAVLPDGKIVVAGDSRGQAAVVRYNPNGSLDSGFSGDGIVTTQLISYLSNHPYTSYSNLAVQADGKVVVAWNSYATEATGIPDFVLLRYTNDGNPDSSFGNAGKVISDLGGIDCAWSIVAQDGKLVVAGESNQHVAVARYDLAGNLDASFGTGGKVVTPVGSTARATQGGLVAQSDGKVVVLNRSLSPANGTLDFTMLRYNPNGSLDATFDGDGIAVTDFFARPADNAGEAVAVQPDGKIVVVGSAQTDFALARYNADGSLDASFGLGGRVTTDFGSTDVARAVVFQTIANQTKILVVGYSGYSNVNFALARYNPDGSLDTTFDTDGKVLTDLGGDDGAWSVAVQTDGKIVVAGTVKTYLYSKWGGAPIGNKLDVAVVRYNTNGSLDTTFSGDGKVITDLGSNYDYARAVLVQPDGKIVVAGSSNNNFALLRYTTTGSLDKNFGSKGKVITDLGGTDTVNAAVLQTVGGQVKILVAGSSNGNFALARYNPNGALDTTFSGDGKLTVDMGTGNDVIASLALQTVGNQTKIVVGGYTDDGTQKNFALARINTDGTLDSSFGNAGKVISDFGMANRDDAIRGIAIDAYGNILAAGFVDFGSPFGWDLALARYQG